MLDLCQEQDLCQRLWRSLGYELVHERFNLTMPELIDYTQQALGGDPQARYTVYSAELVRTMTDLHKAGVQQRLDLIQYVETPEKLEAFSERHGIAATRIVRVLKFVIYWFVPMEKYLSGLIREAPLASEALKVLREVKICTNLDLLQQGATAAGSKALADLTGLPEAASIDLQEKRYELHPVPGKTACSQTHWKHGKVELESAE